MRHKIRQGVAAFIFGLAISVSGQIPTNGLVAFYPLDGNAIDTGGNQLNGTAFNVTATVNRFGQANSALQFNGSNAYIDCGNPAAFNFAGSFTLSAWIKTTGVQANKYIVSKYDFPNSIRSYGMGTSANSNPYGFVQGEAGYVDRAGTVSMNDGKWHALTLVYTDGVGIQIYLDGMVAGQANVADLPPFVNSVPLRIGATYSGQFFGGAIDDVRIYNRALNAAEVSELGPGHSLIQRGIWVPPQGEYAAASTASGNRDYLLTKNKVKILDIADATRPLFLGELILNTNTPNPSADYRMLNEVKVVGNDLYIVGRTDFNNYNLFVVDVSNPEIPRLAKKINFPLSGGDVYGMAIDGNQLYIAKGSAGFEIFSIADRENPVSIGSFTSITATDLEVGDGLAYVAAKAGGLQIVDVTIPSAPWLVGGASAGEATFVERSGNKVYLTYWNMGHYLGVFDVTNPVNPAPLSTNVLVGLPRSISLSENILAVTHHFGVATVLYDVTSTPVEAGRPAMPFSVSLELQGNRLYVAQGPFGLGIYDVSNPTARIRLGGYQVDSRGNNVYVHKDLAYILDDYNGVHVLNVSDPTSPKYISTYLSVDSFSLLGDENIFANDSYTFIGIYGGFDIITVSNMAAVVKIGSYRSGIGVPSLVQVGNYVFTSAGDIVDVSAPANPVKAGTFAAAPNIKSMETAGNFIYYTTDRGVGILDVSSPLSPQTRASVDLGRTTSWALAWPYWYEDFIANIVYDVSLPNEIRQVGQTTNDGLYGGAITLSGQKLYTYESKLKLWDIRDPIHPAEVASVAVVKAADLAASGDLVYHLAENGALRIFQGTLGAPLPQGPTLELVRSGETLVFRWLKEYSDFKLNAVSNLGDPWQIVTTTPFESGAYLTFTNTRPLGMRFYKLAK